jgi:hypothetical protein
MGILLRLHEPRYTWLLLLAICGATACSGAPASPSAVAWGGACAVASDDTPPPVDDPGEAVGGSEEFAACIVKQWLDQVQHRTGDLGWSLLYPSIRTDLIGSPHAYAQAVRAADWRRVRLSVGDVRTVDGEYRVSVHVNGGSSAVPRFMHEWGLIQFSEVDGVPAEDGLIVVRIDPNGGPSGIQATG